MREKPLLGKVAVVTGAGSSIGLGRAMTLALVQAGALVAMMDVNEVSLEQTASDIREIGGDKSVITVVGDVSSPDDAEMAVRRAVTELGGLHILVNNAGIATRGLVQGPESRVKF
jgi:NAD(P)-dependent dehydrogenase (short-subunit alcohol dehydrogenase family)